MALKKCLEDGTNGEVGESPFTKRLEDEPKQRHIKHLNLNPFDGMGDPEEHLSYFNQLALHYEYRDLTKCRFFAATLRGSAQRWFSRVPARSIDTWADFKRAFLNRFRANQPQEVHTSYLQTIGQREGESLQSYINRFKEAVNKIICVNEIEALVHVKRGLDLYECEKYVVKLMEVQPTTLAKAYDLASQAVTEAESLAVLKRARAPPISNQKHYPRERHTPYQKPAEQIRVQTTHGPAISKNNNVSVKDRLGPAVGLRPEKRPEPNWTKFSMTRSALLRDIRNKPFYQAPPAMWANPEDRNKERHCEYHETHGHSTDSCLALKHFLERQVKAGNLNQYLPRDLPPSPPQDHRDGRNVVNPVFGGTVTPPAPGGPSVYAIAQGEVHSPIYFTHADYEGINPDHNEALVVSLLIAENEVKRILVDNGSSTDICFQHTWDRLRLSNAVLEPCLEETPLYGFGHNVVPIAGVAHLPVTFGSPPHQITKTIKFYIINAVSSYNMILGRPTLNALRAIPSTSHLKMKFPTPTGIGEIKGDSETSKRCYGIALVLAATEPGNIKRENTDKRKQEKRKKRVESLQRKNKRHREVQVIETHDPIHEEPPRMDAELKKCLLRDEQPVAKPAVATEQIQVSPTDPTRKVSIGAGLESVFKKELTNLLREYADVFAWSPKDMPGLDESVAMHKLSVDPKRAPKKQKRRNFAPDRQKAIDAEIDKLLDADLICEVSYPDWVANVVLVKKANGKWRMCVDYTDLNAACPKDPYPLPSIDQLIDATAGHLMLSFMDAFSGYNQIKMAPEDCEKTAFITHRGVYCYKVMPFGLINAGATYQCMMNKIFAPQLGRNMEVYVDDMIVKSMLQESHLADLRECFANLRQHNMKLNPDKCTFALEAGKFLGFLVSQRGIEANPEKIQAIIDMQPPKTIKDVQCLTGRLAALRRFISKLAERCLPFFDTLKGALKTKKLTWTDECQKAFEDLKQYLASAPLLTTASPSEPLSLCLSVSDKAVGAVLIKEVEATQRPVYYVSQTLKDAETRYPNTEKAALALVMASRKLRHYFQGREIRVITNQPLRKILHKPELSGRLINWAIELSQFHLTYVPRTAIKAQALADFVVECNFTQPEETTPESHTPIPVTEGWKLYVDGSATNNRCGAGAILISPDGFCIKQALQLNFKATNNQAEYEALLTGLDLALTLQLQNLIIYSDSQLVVRQTTGDYAVKDSTLARYQQQVQTRLSTFKSYQLHQINREDNSIADSLSKLLEGEYTTADGPVYFLSLPHPSIEPKEQFNITLDEDNWMTPLIAYIRHGTLPTDHSKARQVKAHAAKFFLQDNILYRRNFDSPILKCVDDDEATYCMREVHEGICGDHMAGKALTHKILRQGYYWPTMAKDCKAFVRACHQCQLFSNVPRTAPAVPVSILSPIPFAVWGIDIMGPFPKARGELQFVMVAIDYMTKWAEAKALRTITQEDAIRFVRNQIITRFGIPTTLIFDNRTQFVGKKFTTFLSDHGIKHKKASVCHPQSNGQVEVTNRIILRGLKKTLTESKKKWPEHLPQVLCSYRTTQKTSTGETPFKLAFGAEALAPVEIGSPSFRLQNFNINDSIEGMRTNLELLDEVRAEAVQKMELYKEKTRDFFGKRVRMRAFQVGDLVNRATEASDPRHTGKLMPKWEGPYKIAQIIRPGSYKLSRLDGTEVNNTWHAEKLKKYYQ
ncbi:uncharacterized protein LOC135148512 [Daucus carota subsp. sativus]|uniref:uncharacterized protein LOC108198315 n=1 Tax=Daucus carota subsp. sativus TaxID=79200 RepID=UPI0007EFC67B|nr:PREDICTED: uncharacterized protein LOC108198315 [Daucus carota subsp. sativus]